MGGNIRSREELLLNRSHGILAERAQDEQVSPGECQEIGNSVKY